MRLWFVLFVIFIGSGCGGGHGRDRDNAAEQARVLVTDGFFSARGVTYEVDDHLNLDVVRRVRVELRPQIFWQESRECRASTDPRECDVGHAGPLPAGRYLLRYALIHSQSPDLDGPSELLSAGHLEVNYFTGSFVADLSMRVRDLRLLGSRNHLIIELKDMRESGPRASAVYEAAMEPGGAAQLMFKSFDVKALESSIAAQLSAFKPWAQDRDLSAGSLNGVDGLERVADQIKKLEVERSVGLRSNFAVSQNLTDWPVSMDRMGGISRDSMIHALRTHSPDPTLYRSLCEMWVGTVLPELTGSPPPRRTRGMVDSCLASQSPGLSEVPVIRWLAGPYEPFFLMQDIFSVRSARINKAQPPKGRQFMVQVGERFYVRSRVEYNYEAGLHPLSWIPVVGPYLSLAGTLAIDVSHKDDEGKDLHFAVDMPLNVEESAISLDFLDYQRCLIVRANPAKFDDPLLARHFFAVKGEVARDQLRRAFSERGLLVCDSRSSVPVTKTEKYFYVYSGREVGYQHDPGDFATRQVSLPLRGMRDFKAVMGAAKARLVASPGANSAEFDGSGEWSSGVEAGVLSSAPASPGIFLDQVFY